MTIKENVSGHTTGPEIGNFSNVDGTRQAEQLIAFVDKLESLPHAQETREKSYQLLNGRPGERAVDVGCGRGRAVAELSARGIQTIGVDTSLQMISSARERFPAEDFHLAAAEALPFADHTLDLYRAERVYQYLADPAAALREARRVLAPNGRIVLIDPDGDMWALDADNQEMTRALMRAISNTIANRWGARRYRNLLLDAGFVDITIEVRTGIYTDYAQAALITGMAKVGVAAGVVTQQEADDWLGEQKRRDRENRFFMAMPIFIASAHLP
jgi:ubiquinone/menaquinone biosynthesis C-methylase UbiE